MIKRTGWASLAVLIFLLTLAGPVGAVGSGQGQICQPSDPNCQYYTPVCVTCERRGERRCRDVYDGETGADNCQVIYSGAYAISCTAYGISCTHITVNG
jgi:hypothetical protein